MDIKYKYWDLELKHILLSHLYSLMNIKYSGAILDFIKEKDTLQVWVTLPNVCEGVTGKIDVPMKTIKKYEPTDLCIGIQEHIDDIIIKMEGETND